MAEPVSAARNVVEALVAWARDETGRVGDVASDTVSSALRELGFVTHSEHEELALRVSQLEHRLRLLEASELRRDASPVAPVDEPDARPLG